MDNDTSNSVNTVNNGNNGNIGNGQGEREDRGNGGNGGNGGGSTVTMVPRLNLTGGEITSSSSSSSSSSSAFDPVLEREIRSSWEKYRHYMTEGTPEGGPEGDGTGTVAPMNQKWVRGALELLPPPPEGVPKELVENLIKDILGEMNEDYENSVRKSILDYVLKSGSEAARLHITVLQADNIPEEWGWGKSRIFAEPPEGGKRSDAK